MKMAVLGRWRIRCRRGTWRWYGCAKRSHRYTCWGENVMEADVMVPLVGWEPLSDGGAGWRGDPLLRSRKGVCLDWWVCQSLVHRLTRWYDVIKLQSMWTRQVILLSWMTSDWYFIEMFKLFRIIYSCIFDNLIE